jgi:hypothetical protein
MARRRHDHPSLDVARPGNRCQAADGHVCSGSALGRPIDPRTPALSYATISPDCCRMCWMAPSSRQGVRPRTPDLGGLLRLPGHGQAQAIKVLLRLGSRDARAHRTGRKTSKANARRADWSTPPWDRTDSRSPGSNSVRPRQRRFPLTNPGPRRQAAQWCPEGIAGPNRSGEQ